MEDEFYAFASFVVGTNALALLMWAKNRRNLPDNVTYIGRVEGLFVYPVKSCPAIEVDNAVCTPVGLQISELVKDRHFAIITEGKNGEPCQVLTQRQRQCPRLALVRVTLASPDNGDGKASVLLRFSAPDMPNLDIQLPIKHQAISGTQTILTARLWGVTIHGKDCGPYAASWFRLFLGRDDVFLMHAESEEHLKALGDSSGLLDSVVKRLKSTDKTAYADWAPLLLINSASIEDVNARILSGTDENERASFKPVTYVNFRPSILLNTRTPYDEDNFDQIFIAPSAFVDSLVIPKTTEGDDKITFQLDANKTKQAISSSSVILRNVKPCDRCVLTTVDPARGERRADGQPLKTLKTFRLHKGYGNSPLFGINCVPDKMGKISVGDIVLASYTKK